MKTRIIAAAVLVPILLLILLAAPKVAAAIVLGVLLAIAAFELLYRTGLVTNIRLVMYSAAMAFALSMWSYLGRSEPGLCCCSWCSLRCCTVK